MKITNAFFPKCRHIFFNIQRRQRRSPSLPPSCAPVIGLVSKSNFLLDTKKNTFENIYHLRNVWQTLVIFYVRYYYFLFVHNWPQKQKLTPIQQTAKLDIFKKLNLTKINFDVKLKKKLKKQTNKERKKMHW